jgi:arylsulfatase A-like enzyme
MRARPSRILAATSLVVIAVGGCTREPETTPASSKRPNAILVIIDTLRADHLPTYGYPRPTAPNIEALGKRGWVFDRALAQSGWTLPATGSLLSGLLPITHGGIRTDDSMGFFGKFDPSTPTTAETFAAAGYRTGAIVNNSFLGPKFGFDRGFDFFVHRAERPFQRRSAVETVEMGLAWLDQSTEPAFLLLHFMEPHAAYAARKPERGRFAPAGKNLQVRYPFRRQDGKRMRDPSQFTINQVEGLYDEEVRAADRGVGDLVRGLSVRGLLDETWIVVTSDHGEEFWDHGGFEHGHHLMGELVRVPLVIVGPGVTPRRIEKPVTQMDVHATLVARTHHEDINPGRGIDLAWALEEPGRLPADRAVVAENCMYGDPQRATVTRGRYRLETNFRTGTSSLFELDAFGQNDRPAVDKEALREELAALLEQIRGDRRAPRSEAGAARIDDTTREHLRALGYLE